MVVVAGSGLARYTEIALPLDKSDKSDKMSDVKVETSHPTKTGLCPGGRGVRRALCGVLHN